MHIILGYAAIGMMTVVTAMTIATGEAANAELRLVDAAKLAASAGLASVDFPSSSIELVGSESALKLGAQ